MSMRRKFSIRNFWSDCIKYKATVTQYVGEICRFLLSQPESPLDRAHKIRLVIGNGLRPQIWPEFIRRFGIQQVGEFYGSTEGNSNIVNMYNVVGSVGFSSRILPAAFPVRLIKVDEDTGELIRDSRGICLPTKPNEAGELVGRIVRGDAVLDFLGYSDQKENDKKIVRDVFKKGDLAFLTGDVMVQDELGNFYFRDRTGDTFRWKGENVSTQEVDGIVSKILGFNAATCYGVLVPGNEGRAGMVAILAETDIESNVEKLASQLPSKLPPYARPLFLRFVKTLDTTGTFKVKKNTLKSEGFNPGEIKDPLYYFNSKVGKFETLTDEVYKKLQRCELRL